MHYFKFQTESRIPEGTVLWICSLGNISVVVTGKHAHDTSKEWQTNNPVITPDCKNLDFWPYTGSKFLPSAVNFWAVLYQIAWIEACFANP